jgi:glycosyltransferase involved in cell wall biosynthesis
MKIILHSVTGHTIYCFRLPLIKALQDKGIEVVALCKKDEYVPLLNELGVRVIESGNNVKGVNPLIESAFVFKLYKIFKKESPDLVHHFTPKAVIFGSVASKLAGVQTVASITGLGHAFLLPKFHPVSVITKILYYGSNFFIDKFIFQNGDDYKLFIKKKITQKKKSRIILSSGVDLEVYKPCLDASEQKNITFTFVGRLLFEKGVGEFLKAAQRVHENHPEAKFLLVGDGQYDNPSLLSKEELNNYLKNNKQLQYLGKVMDVNSVYEKTSVIVLPSYREGVPRSVLEAMAHGKPVITTDTVGCRETTIDGHNGWLVPVKNVGNLALAMEKFLLEPKSINSMGRNSFNLVKKRFDSKKVVKRTFDTYSSLGLKL